MNVKEIKELVDLVARRGIAALELERAGFRIRIEGPRSVAVPPLRPVPAYPAGEAWEAAPVAFPAAAAPAPAAAPAGPVREVVDEGIHFVTSPIVGTFYRSPNPDAEPFVKVGDAVEKGKVLCIIEAMKLMNEIESDVSGAIVEVFPQNGQPVEYGERLFAVKVR